MPIKKPSELDFSNKKYEIIIAGLPGLGKSTLAQSSPKPLLIDLDRGIDRVDAEFRRDTMVVNDYASLLQELKTDDLSAYDTIIIDTGGVLIDFMKDYAIADNSKNAKSDGTLALCGYGFVNKTFNDFHTYLKSLNKHIVWCFHAKEVSEDDILKLRLDVEGKTKDTIWRSVDIGGFIEMKGKDRVLTFAPCQKFYAKQTHGVADTYILPDIHSTHKNTFLTDLITHITTTLNSEVKSASKDKEEYEYIMNTLRPRIEDAKNENDINDLLFTMKNTKFALTSEVECKALFSKKVKELKLQYNKELNAYEPTLPNNANPA
ncbi:MAG: ATP-binding protein [Candidatus Paceibacterota bacterium]